MRRWFLGIIVGIVLCSSPALALVSIDGVTDISFGTWSGGTPSAQLMYVCIYNDADPGTTYVIRARGSGSSYSFALRKGATSSYVDFDVAWRDQSGSWETLTANSYSSTFSGTNKTLGCGTSNATVRFTLDQSDLASAPAGSYSGSVTFELAPQ